MARSKVLTVEIAEQQIRNWEKIRDILLRIEEKENDDFYTRIVKKYLKYGSVSLVASELTEEGFRVQSKSTGKPCKISTNDISNVIRDYSIDDCEMQQLAQMILSDHTAFMNKLFN